MDQNSIILKQMNDFTKQIKKWKKSFSNSQTVNILFMLFYACSFENGSILSPIKLIILGTFSANVIVKNTNIS